VNYQILERYDVASYTALREDLSRLNDALLEDGLTRPQAVAMVDMVAISSAEMAASLSYATARDINLPLVVTPSMFTLSALKTDTVPTRKCTTPARIESGDVDLPDLFLFTSDFDKFIKVFGRDLRLDALQDSFTERIEKYVDTVTESSVSNALGISNSRSRSYLFLVAIFWRLRLNILMQNEDEQANEGDVVNLLERWSVSGVELGA
jgi:hypothetical protein